MRRLLPLAALALLSACGGRGALKPAPGAALPVKPYGAVTTPTPDQLVQPAAQARPERSDELLQNSTPRGSDPFSLPPPN